MPNVLLSSPPMPFESASDIRREHADLLKAMDQRLGEDSRPESETAALREIEPQIRTFLTRGVETGAFIEDIKERTACQILLDYWSSTLSHAGTQVARERLVEFDAARLPDLKDKPCPYVGLEPFRDSTFFFGRDKARDSLLKRVAEVQLVVVQGASGSGKSSLLIGGALPVLGAAGHAPRFRVVGPFTPGNAVLENLVGAVAAALPGASFGPADVAALRTNTGRLAEMLNGPEAPPTLLIVDQFEEVFTLCSEPDRNAAAAILDVLLKARPDNRVILTLREEFSNELDKIEPLRPYLSQHPRFSMKEWPMGYEELKAAIERPAALVNLQFAPGIIDEMVKSVLGRDTALPLLQFALRRLWELRDRNRITRDVYAKIGGSPLAALERFADGFYNGLGLPELQREVERILLELVYINQLLEPYRRPRRRSELMATGTPRTPAVLELLAQADFVHIRPLSGGEEAVEVKHEALLRNWPLYIRWIEGKREQVRHHIALTEAAQRWDRGGRNTQYLLGGGQLQEAKELHDLTGLENEYVQESIKAADTRNKALRRQERVKDFIVFVCVAVIVLGAWQFRSSQIADVERQIARAQLSSYRGQIGDALTQAVQAVAAARRLKFRAGAKELLQARDMLLPILGNTTDLERLFVADKTGPAIFRAVAFQPSQPAVLAFPGSGGKTYLAELDKPKAGAKPVPDALQTCDKGTSVDSLAFDREGRRMAAGCDDGTLSVWSVADWRQLGSVKVFDRRLWAIAFSRDGQLIFAGGPGIEVVQLDKDGAPRKPRNKVVGELPKESVWSLAFSPTEDRFLAGDGVGRVLDCPLTKGAWKCQSKNGYANVDSSDPIRALAFSPDGKKIAIGHWKGRVEVLNKDFGEKTPLDFGDPPDPVYSLVFFKACDRDYLAIGNEVGLHYRTVPLMKSDEQESGKEFEQEKKMINPNPQVAPPSDKDCVLPPSASVGDETYGVAYHRESGRIAAATARGYVAVLIPKGGQDPPGTKKLPKDALAKTRKPVRGAVVAEDGSRTLLAVPISPNGDKNLELWSLHDGTIDNKPVEVAVGKGEIKRVSASKERHTLAMLGCRPDCNKKSTYNVTVCQFSHDFKSCPPKKSLTSTDFGKKIPFRIALSPDGNWLAVSFAKDEKGEKDSKLMFVDLSSGGQKQKDSGLKGVSEIAFSHDGKYFAAGGEAKDPPQIGKKSNAKEDARGLHSVQLWKVKSTFEKLHSPSPLSPSANRVHDLAFAEDKRGNLLLLAGGDSGNIDRWELVGGSRLEPVIAGSAPIYQIAFNGASSRVATSDSRNVVRLWSTSESDWVPLQLKLPTDYASSGFIAFGGNGTWLVSGGDTLRLWNLDVDSLQHKLCARLRKVGGAKEPSILPWPGCAML